MTASRPLKIFKEVDEVIWVEEFRDKQSSKLLNFCENWCDFFSRVENLIFFHNTKNSRR